VITAVDTSVLFDLLLDDPVHARSSVAALRIASSEGRLVASGPVWAEVHAGLADPRLPRALTDLGVTFEPLQQSAAELAGQLWARYRERGGGRRDRIVADFLIGAHALTQADRLLTRDRGFYRDYFDDLTVLDPAVV